MSFIIRAERGFAVAEALPTERHCARCKGTGWAPTTRADGATAVGRCRCQMPADQARAFSRARIPKSYAHHELTGWDTGVFGKSALKAVESWAADAAANAEAPWLVLVGPPGVGKTHLAIGLCKRLVLHGERLLSARFVEPNMLVQAMKRAMRDENPAPEAVASIVEVGVLVIDDLVAPRTDFERSVIDELVTRRFAHGGITILTTNLTGDLGDVLGERAGSRLHSGCFVTVIGADRRRAAA